MKQEQTMEERFNDLLFELQGQTDFSKYVKSFHFAKLESFIKNEIALAVQKDRERSTSFAESVISLDRTPHYAYGNCEQAKNANGELPDGGGRWNTPREMAKDFIKEINQE